MKQQIQSLGTRQKHERRTGMSKATQVEVVHNPIKVCTVEGKYTNDNHKLTTRLCLENAVIADGTWDLAINCVKVYSENIIKTNIMNSVNISTNLVRGYQNTDHGVQSFNPTVASFFLKVGGNSINQRHALYDLSPIKWFTITNPNTYIELNVEFWPSYTLKQQLRLGGDLTGPDLPDFILNFQIDVHLLRIQ